MHSEKGLVLGYAKKLNTNEDKEFLVPENFPSKIGGQPIWIIPEKIPQLKCQLCNGPLTFLGQIYAPLKFDSTFHRSLYIFYCKETTCSNQYNNIKIFRGQLPKVNKYYQALDNDTYKILYKQESKVDEEEVKCNNLDQINQEFEIETEVISMEDNLNDLEQALTKLVQSKEVGKIDKKIIDYLQKYVNIEQLEEKENNSNQYKKENALYSDYVKIKNTTESEDEEQDAALQKEFDVNFKTNKLDDYFEIYTQVLYLDPEQIIRYQHDEKIMPLWYRIEGQWENDKIPVCPICKEKRIFELQINNSILNIDSTLSDLNWGMIAIYTCQNSCQLEGQNYYEEVAFLQTDDDLGDKFKQLMISDKSKNPKDSAQEQQMTKNQKKKKKKQQKKLEQQYQQQMQEMIKKDESDHEEDDWV